MKILIISPSLDTSVNVSGISSVVRLIVSNNPLHKYVHFQIGKPDAEPRRLSWILRTLILYPQWFYNLLFNKFDVIHFNLGLSRMSVIRDAPLILCTRVLKRRIILHVHGGIFMYNRAGKFLTAIIRKLVKGKIQVIALSKPEKEMLINRYKAGNVAVLPNCIDLTDAKGFDINEKGNKELSMLFMGRLNKEKGLDELYNALLSVRKHGYKFKLFLAGTGPDETYYVSKFREHFGECFEFLGVVSGSNKIEVLKKCRIFVLPSHFEGLPMSLLEAMSFAEVPVVTDVGSIHTVVRDKVNGLLVKPTDSCDLEKAISSLCSGKVSIGALGLEAQKTIFNKFGPELYISSLNEVYSKV